MDMLGATHQGDKAKGFRAVLLAYGLMASCVFSLFIGPVAALIIAGLRQRDPETEGWLRSHCKNLQQLFVFGGVVPTILGYAVWTTVGYGIVKAAQSGQFDLRWETVAFSLFASLMIFMSSIWSVYRFAKGIAALYDHEAV